MTLIDETIKDIMASLEPLESGDYGEIMIIKAILDDAPPLSIYQERAPDCLCNVLTSSMKIKSVCPAFRQSHC